MLQTLTLQLLIIIIILHYDLKRILYISFVIFNMD